MKHKLLALFTAGMMLVSASALPSASAADQPSMDSVIGTLPDWTPMNFADAMQLYNTYGKSHVEDNFICLVKPVRLDEKDKYKTSYSGSMAMIDTPACTSPAFFTLDIPKQPDPNDAEALAEYEEYCNILGIPTDDYSFFEAYQESEVQYGFEVQMFRVLEDYDLTVTWTKTIGDKELTLETFSFENQYGYTVPCCLRAFQNRCSDRDTKFSTNHVPLAAEADLHQESACFRNRIQRDSSETHG